jgi:hypothetical protein
MSSGVELQSVAPPPPYNENNNNNGQGADNGGTASLSVPRPGSAGVKTLASAPSSSFGGSSASLSPQSALPAEYARYLDRLRAAWPDLPSVTVGYTDLGWSAQVARNRIDVPTLYSSLRDATLGLNPFSRKKNATLEFRALQQCNGLVRPGEISLILAPPGHGTTGSVAGGGRAGWAGDGMGACCSERSSREPEAENSQIALVNIPSHLFSFLSFAPCLCMFRLRVHGVCGCVWGATPRQVDAAQGAGGSAESARVGPPSRRDSLEWSDVFRVPVRRHAVGQAGGLRRPRRVALPHAHRARDV